MSYSDELPRLAFEKFCNCLTDEGEICPNMAVLECFIFEDSFNGNRWFIGFICNEHLTHIEKETYQQLLKEGFGE